MISTYKSMHISIYTPYDPILSLKVIKIYFKMIQKKGYFLKGEYVVWFLSLRGNIIIKSQYGPLLGFPGGSSG